MQIFPPAPPPVRAIYVPTEFTTIQDALGDCSGGEYIIVSPKQGGYTNIHIEITDSTLKDNGDPGEPNWNGSPITIKGYRGTPSASVLQGDGTNPVFFIDGIDVMIRALTIEYGAGKDLSTTAYAGNVVAGGGICACPHSAIIIENCVIQNNQSIQPDTTKNVSYGAKGGGVYIGPIGSDVPEYGYQVTLSDCFIHNNVARRVSADTEINCKGAGIYCKGLGKGSLHGSGSSLKYNHITDNLCEDYGGGLCIEMYGSSSIDSPYTLEGNEFVRNHLLNGNSGEGSAMASFSTLEFYGSSTLLFVNNLLYQNGLNEENEPDQNRRPAVFIRDIDHSQIVNNTFAYNSRDTNGTMKVKANTASRLVECYNNIFYYNLQAGEPQIWLIGDTTGGNQLTALFDQNCIQFGAASIYVGEHVNLTPGTIVITQPFFKAGTNNYHISQYSTEIEDRGESSSSVILYLPAIDYYGGPRILIGWFAEEVDLGADEFDPSDP